MIRLDSQTILSEAHHAIFEFEAPEDVDVAVGDDARSVTFTLHGVGVTVEHLPEFVAREQLQRGLNVALAKLAMLDVNKRCHDTVKTLPAWVVRWSIRLHLTRPVLWWMKRRVMKALR